MDISQIIFNVVLIVFIASTMLTAGFSTTFDDIQAVFSKVGLVLLVLGVSFVARPLVGWGTAAVFGLPTPAIIAMVLIWSCPGAPIGTKLVIAAKADVQTGASLNMLLAVVGSVLFAPIANLIFTGMGLEDDIALPVGQLILTVAGLQLVPFAIGLFVRKWAEARALAWVGLSGRVAGISFLLMIALALLGSWQTLVGLVGTLVLLAAVVSSAAMIAVGYLGSTGAPATRQAAALIQPCSNTGPVLAAVALAFGGNDDIVGPVVALLLLQIVVGFAVAKFFARGRGDPATSSATR